MQIKNKFILLANVLFQPIYSLLLGIWQIIILLSLLHNREISANPALQSMCQHSTFMTNYLFSNIQLLVSLIGLPCAVYNHIASTSFLLQASFILLLSSMILELLNEFVYCRVYYFLKSGHGGGMQSMKKRKFRNLFGFCINN